MIHPSLPCARQATTQHDRGQTLTARVLERVAGATCDVTVTAHAPPSPLDRPLQSLTSSSVDGVEFCLDDLGLFGRPPCLSASRVYPHGFKSIKHTVATTPSQQDKTSCSTLTRGWKRNCNRRSETQGSES